MTLPTPSPNTMTARLIALLHRQWVSPQTALRRVNCFSLAQRISRDIKPYYTVEKRWMYRVEGRPVRQYRIVGAKK